MRAVVRRCLPVRFFLLAICALLAGGLAGCATPPPADDPDAVADFRQTNDPLEPTNRVFYAINNGIDTVILRPLAIAYRAVLPETVREHTHNVLNNLGTPVQLFNDILETKPRRAGDTLMRLLLNTTVGVGGVFDVATPLGWPNHEADGGITLALWGIPNGPYLFLPVFGPSSPREAAGSGVDYVVNPLSWIGKGNTVNLLGYARYGVGALDARSRVLDDLDKVKANALDPYATISSLYRQHRESTIEEARDADDATIPAWFPQPVKPAGGSQTGASGASKP